MANTAGVTFDTSLSTNPSNSAITLVNLGTSTKTGLVTSDKLTYANGDSIVFGASTGSGASGVYHGTTSGTAATPYNDTSNYYAAEPGAGVTFAYAATQYYFGILWGSVDTGNTLSFYNGTTLIYTLTGSQVTSSANGSQGSSGTDYVNINFSQLGFTSVVATSSSPAFEFAQIASAPTTVPVNSTQTGTPTTVTPTDSVTNQPVCFLRGTMIAIPGGEKAVEAFEINDPILTADGRISTVRWIGVNTISMLFADPERNLPIRIRAGSLAENIPTRDLLVSPDHAMFIDGMLIQAGALLNGISIVRETRMPEVFTYYHVELENHALVLAEGAATETFVDNVGRMTFDNWAERQALFGEAASIAEMGYPRAKAARQIPSASRAHLEARRALFIEEKAAAA